MSNYYGDVERVITDVPTVENIVPVFGNPDPYDIVCAYCGCDAVQEKVWTEINSGRTHDSCDDGEVYCPDCEEHVATLERHEWEDRDDDEDDDN